MMTVIISLNEVAKPGVDSLYPNGIKTNGEVAITINGEFLLLGVHAKKGDDYSSYIENFMGMRI